MAIRQTIQDLYKKVQPLASSIKDSVSGFAERNELDNPEFYKQLLSRKNLQENAANVFGRQGLASGKGLEAAAKGVYRGAVQPVAELGVNVAVSPQFRDMALNAVRAPGRLNESNLTDAQKNILQGFNIAGAIAPYSAAEKIAVQGLSRALPKVAQSQAGQFAIRRGADVASGQLFMDPNATAQQRLQQAAGDVAFGGVIDAASSATRLAPRFNQELQKASQPRMTQMPDGSMRMTQPVFTAGGNIGEAVSNMRKAEPNVRERSFTKAAKQSPDFSQATREQIPTIKYDVRDTQELAQRVSQQVDADFGTAYSRVKAGTDLSDVGIAEAIEVSKRLDAQGLRDEAVDVLVANAERLTQLGQAVQAASLMSRLSETGSLAWATRIAKEAGKELTSKQKSAIETLAKRAEEARLGLEGAKTLGKSDNVISAMERNAVLSNQELVKAIASVNPSPALDQLAQVWRAGLLTGLKTTGLNIAANTSQSILKKISDIPASAFDAGIGAVTGQRTKAFTLKGTGVGTVKGLKEGIDYLVSGYDPRMAGSKAAELGTKFSDNVLGKIGQVYSDNIYRFIGSQDRPFFYGSLYNSLADQGIAAAKNAKLAGKQAKDFVENFVANPPREAAEIAAREAEQAVFQNPTTIGKLAKAIQNAPGGKFIAPFAQTPSAVITEIFNYTPVGAIAEAGKQIKNRKLDQRLLVTALGKTTTGAGILWLGSQMYDSGIINGAYPINASERARWEAENRRPNTIVVDGPDGKKLQIDMQSLGSAGSILGIGAAMAQAGQEGEGALAAGAFTAGNQLLSAPFLQGTSGIIEAGKDPLNAGQRFVNQQVGSTVPTLSSDIAQFNDTDPLTGEARAVRPETAGQAIQARIPGLRNELPQEVDILGRGRTTGRAGFQIIADPTRSTTLRQDPITDELGRLQSAGFLASLTKPDKKTKQLGGESMDKEGLRNFTRVAGADFTNRANALINSPQYQSATDEQKSSAIGKLYAESKDIAKKQIAVGNVAGINAQPSTVQSAGSQKPTSAEKELAKARVEAGEEVSAINERFGYRLDQETGEAKFYDKTEIRKKAENKRLEQSISRAKDAGNYKDWEKFQEQKFQALQNEYNLLDPDFDAVRSIEIENQLAQMIEDVAKYRGYGGAFKKPSAGSKARKVSGITPVNITQISRPAANRLQRVSAPQARISVPTAPRPSSIRNYFS